MADFTQTVTNSLTVLSASPPNLWNNFNWGDNWGQDEDLWTESDKGVTNLLSLTLLLSKSIVKSPLTETLTLTENLESLRRSLGDWDYVFTKPTTDGDEAIYDESSKVANASTSWSSVSEASSTWSDA